MKKQLIFLYRYFISRRRWRRWINARTLLVAALSAMVLTLMIWTSPKSAPPSQAPSATVTVGASAGSITITPSAVPTRTRTPFPPEFYTNQRETDGVTLAGTLLVLIAIIGVLVFFPKKDEA